MFSFKEDEILSSKKGFLIPVVIIRSQLIFLDKLLKNDFNCILVNVNEDEKWSKAIQLAFKKSHKNKYLRQNAYKTVKKYTWDKRCQRIIHFSK